MAAPALTPFTFSHSHHSLHTFFVCSDVSLNGLVLFCGSLDSRKVKSKVVLREKGTERMNTKFKSHPVWNKETENGSEVLSTPVNFEGWGVPKVKH